MGTDIVINLAEFSRYPTGRDEVDAKYNGKKFRVEVLAPAIISALERGVKVRVSLRGVMSFGSSFLEEAFGGLVRDRVATKEQLQTILIIDPGSARFERRGKAIWKHIINA
ncbi:STAS-like domain-containing protein [Pseudoroseicyclus sp. H15]